MLGNCHANMKGRTMWTITGFHSYCSSGKAVPCIACIQDIRNQHRESSCSIDSCWNYIPEWSSCNSRAQLCRLSYISRIRNKLIGRIVAKSHTLQIGTCYRVSCVLTCCERQCWKLDQWVEHCNDMHGIICLAMHTNTSTWKINNRKALQIGADPYSEIAESSVISKLRVQNNHPGIVCHKITCRNIKSTGTKLIVGTLSCDVKNVMLRANSLECNACLLLKRGEQPR